MIKNEITLSVANERQNPKNKHYPNVRQVSSMQELSECLKFDHVAGLFTNNERGNENFIKTNCLIMDLDNDSDNLNDWKTPEYIQEKLPGVEFFTCYSRNHMKPKGEKAARPKFHVYFVLNKEITEADMIRRYKEKLLSVIPEFDKNAKDAARFIYGVEKPEILYFDGDIDIITFLDAIPDSEPNLFATSNETSRTALHTEAKKAEAKSENLNADIIHEGGRNAELYARGLDIIATYENVDDAKKAFWQECLKCSPRLDNEEYATIWQHILSSDTKKLADMARSIGDRQKFISEAESKKFDKALILTVAKAVFSNPPAPNSKAVSDLENAPAMSKLEALISLAQEILIKYSNLNKARELYEQATNGNFDVEDINNAWNEAFKSIPVKLSFYARQMKDNREAYISLAKGITDDSELIYAIWNKVNEKKTGGGFQKIEKKPVNVTVVEQALKDLGITIRRNVITQEIEVFGLPTNSEYVLADFHKLPEKRKIQAGSEALNGILLDRKSVV